MSQGSLARRYAKALMEIGEAEGTYQRIGSDVESLAGAIKTSEQLAEVLSNPAFPRSERQKIVLAILERVGATKTVINFAKLLVDRERLSIVPDISRELNAMIDEKSGQLTAEVTSFKPLSPSQEADLKSTLETLSGKKIQIESSQDPELLGGVIAKVGDLVYDGSLRTQLQELRRELTH